MSERRALSPRAHRRRSPRRRCPARCTRGSASPPRRVHRDRIDPVHLNGRFPLQDGQHLLPCHAVADGIRLRLHPRGPRLQLGLERRQQQQHAGDDGRGRPEGGGVAWRSSSRMVKTCPQPGKRYNTPAAPSGRHALGPASSLAFCAVGGVAPPERLASHPPAGRLFQARSIPGTSPMRCRRAAAGVRFSLPGVRRRSGLDHP